MMIICKDIRDTQGTSKYLEANGTSRSGCGYAAEQLHELVSSGAIYLLCEQGIQGAQRMIDILSGNSSKADCTEHTLSFSSDCAFPYEYLA